MGQLIEYGSRIQKIGIDKFDCAEGVVVKAMFLNYSRPYARNLAYDEFYKCSVECTEEMALKYGLKPRPRYFFLVAAFQQDMQGNILGDTEAKITYMSMSNGQYEQFLAQSNNLDKWNGFTTLRKIVKKDGDGKDLSYIEATPASSNAQGFKGALSKALVERITSLVKDEGLLNTSIQMIDAVTGLYEDKYVERINQMKAQVDGGKTSNQQPSAPTNGGKTAIQQPSAPTPQAIPQATNPNVVTQSTSVGTMPATHQVQSGGNTAPIADAQVVEGDMQPIDDPDLPF